jgi:hypothetical protein
MVRAREGEPKKVVLAIKVGRQWGATVGSLNLTFYMYKLAAVRIRDPNLEMLWRLPVGQPLFVLIVLCNKDIQSPFL